MRGRLIGATALLGAQLLVGPAFAYVRSTTKVLTPTAWDNPKIDLLLYVGNPPNYLDRATLVKAVHAAAAVWSKPAVACTDLVMTVTETEEAVADASVDKVNRIGFRRDEWKKNGANCDPKKDLCVNYAMAAIAITTVTSMTRSGEIIDADMEINAVDKEFVDVETDGTAHVGSDVQDLQNTVTHELGHLIGLDHTCWNALPPDMKPIPKNNLGIESPSCSGDISAEVRSATMFAQAVTREVEKRSLEVDDLLAVCDIYPVGYLGVASVDDDGAKGGCSMNAGHGQPRDGSGGAAGLSLLGFGFAVSGVAAARRRLRGARR